MQKKNQWVGRHASFPPRRSVKNSIDSYQHLNTIRRLTFWHSPEENWQFSVTAQKNWRETTETENQFHYTES